VNVHELYKSELLQMLPVDLRLSKPSDQFREISMIIKRSYRELMN